MQLKVNTCVGIGSSSSSGPSGGEVDSRFQNDPIDTPPQGRGFAPQAEGRNTDA